jgi:cytoskeletal protein CcmA (bactofilin family)
MAQAACTIGTGIVVNGRLSGSDDVSVEGRLEGTVALDAHLHVDEAGQVVADVEVVSITIDGRLEGNVVASDAITLNSGSAVVGNLRAPRVIIEEGARFKGNIDMDVSLPN